MKTHDITSQNSIHIIQALRLRKTRNGKSILQRIVEGKYRALVRGEKERADRVK